MSSGLLPKVIVLRGFPVAALMLFVIADEIAGIVDAAELRQCIGELRAVATTIVDAYSEAG